MNHLVRSLLTALLFLFSAQSFADLEVRFPVGADDTTYSLSYSSWETCDLFTSTQDRTASCHRDGNNEAVDLSLCEAPELTQACTPDYTYSFSYGAWGICDLYTSIQERDGSCLRDHDSVEVEYSFCGTPVVAQFCTPNYTYSFNYGAWGTCDIYTASQDRTASCLRDHDSLVVDNSFCGTATTSQGCTPDYTYSFNYSTWSTCDLYSSTQSRTASCLRNDGSTVDNSFCGTPTTLQSCSPAYTYSFDYGDWGACDIYTASQDRTASCLRDHDSLEVDNSFCGTPTTSQGCTPNYTYSFNYSSWSSCDLYTATQDRTASCLRNDGSTVDNSFCGTPTTSQGCTPNYTYSFNYSSWSSCDLYTATQSRTASCLRNDGSTVSNSFCGTPTTSQSCTPNYSYSLSYGSWGSCNASNVKTRTATCTRNDGANVSTSFCGSVVTSQACSLTATMVQGAVTVSEYSMPSWYSTSTVTIPGTSYQGIWVSTTNSYHRVISLQVQVVSQSRRLYHVTYERWQSTYQ